MLITRSSNIYRALSSISSTSAPITTRLKSSLSVEPQNHYFESRGELKLTQATQADANQIWSLLQPVFRLGEPYPVDPQISRDEALDYWTKEGKTAFIAWSNGQAVGTYYIRPNALGGGKHVCNCGFMTASEARGKGVARHMLEHALAEAKHQGYQAMQFNYVLENNDRAIAVWKSYGFETIGRVPQGFLLPQPKQGYVDVLIMHKHL